MRRGGGEAVRDCAAESGWVGGVKGGALTMLNIALGEDGGDARAGFLG